MRCWAFMPSFCTSPSIWLAWATPSRIARTPPVTPRCSGGVMASACFWRLRMSLKNPMADRVLLDGRREGACVLALSTAGAPAAYALWRRTVRPGRARVSVEPVSGARGHQRDAHAEAGGAIGDRDPAAGLHGVARRAEARGPERGAGRVEVVGDERDAPQGGGRAGGAGRGLGRADDL